MPHFLRYPLTAILLTLLAACGAEPPPEPDRVRPVRAIKVADGGALAGRSFSGRAKATREVDLSFRVAGELMVLAEDIVGKQYQRGELVARLDPRDYEVELENVKGQLARGQASLERAESDYQRVQRIRAKDPGATSQAELDRKRAARDRARADLKALTASVDTAQDRLKYTYLYAPFDGSVVSQYVQNFEHVKAQQSIVRMLDVAKVEMVVHIPENMISYTPYISNIRVRFDAFPDLEVPATIKEVGKEASRTTRTYPVTLLMEQPEGKQILPGMAGRTYADNSAPELGGTSAIVVPISAIFSPQESNQSFVWVVDTESKTASENGTGTGTVSRREVRVGELSDAGIPVTSGLKPGEWVVTAGVSYLKPGLRVKLLDAEGN